MRILIESYRLLKHNLETAPAISDRIYRFFTGEEAKPIVDPYEESINLVLFLWETEFSRFKASAGDYRFRQETKYTHPDFYNIAVSYSQDYDGYWHFSVYVDGISIPFSEEIEERFYAPIKALNEAREIILAQEKIDRATASTMALAEKIIARGRIGEVA